MNASPCAASPSPAVIQVGMVGLGMIFDETYRPFFRQQLSSALYDDVTGPVRIELADLVSRTGRRAEAWVSSLPRDTPCPRSLFGDHALDDLLAGPASVVCIATPDDRHFEVARSALKAGKHVLIEKPSVLDLAQLDELTALAAQNGCLAKVVYHKLLDPDHKRLRTLVADGVLRHVNNGYCSLLEPKSIALGQFAEWITGRNPATYVAVHYIKLIDFTFGGRLKTVSAAGQRGLLGSPEGATWDSVQLRLGYWYDDGREAAFDIHTSWVTPDNFPGYVEQEVQFRFDNGLWNGHSRKRGVELTVEGETPLTRKITLNNHYNGQFLEPWGVRAQRGYGIEVIEQFFREVAYVEFGGSPKGRSQRFASVATLPWNSVAADRQTVAAVQALEAILAHAAAGRPDALVRVNTPDGGLVLSHPGQVQQEILYPGWV